MLLRNTDRLVYHVSQFSLYNLLDIVSTANPFSEKFTELHERGNEGIDLDEPERGLRNDERLE